MCTLFWFLSVFRFKHFLMYVHSSNEHFSEGFFDYFYSFRLDVQYQFVDYLYTPTYTRIGAYFVGVYAGWFLSAKDRKLNIKKVNYVHCTLCLFFLLLSHFDFMYVLRRECLETVHVMQYCFLLWYNHEPYVVDCVFPKRERWRKNKKMKICAVVSIEMNSNCFVNMFNSFVAECIEHYRW